MVADPAVSVFVGGAELTATGRGRVCLSPWDGKTTAFLETQPVDVCLDLIAGRDHPIITPASRGTRGGERGHLGTALL